ncbi:MBOAT family O-acyltransferase [Paenibacillus silagei]|uniref:Alginate O-acetyltransferase complex protein AlgI n=1 Tax=Paenibacillus silagei TaxID=1670801 RepID=A0ABS4NPC4_9BACL|nr:MBOAT family protein [Paenibacillus silagei]MBP2111917.1 alginate O-acetyltransferase complex protein AlgI [Paenibacillus silagei]
MVFSSLIFVFLFLPVTLLIYYISPMRIRNAVLLAASLIFYAWGEPVYIFLMIFSAVFDYVNGILIDRYRQRKVIAHGVLILSMMGSLGMLGFYKYAGFVFDNINSLFNLHLQAAELPLPVGISFYTFQTMSYIIDVYRRKVPVQKNLIAFGAYVTMFPQLVAGPIVKYEDIAGQLANRKVTLEHFGEGAELFITGLAKKVLLANNIGVLWASSKAVPAAELSVLSAWLGIIAFTFQLYFDFSGYSDMARGLGKMIGFEFMENFNYPYISKSITEFWRRWHISLGSWFREYIYIPLGGNRAGKLKQLRNLAVVWFITGLWHGASWNFIIWGLYFGLFVTLEKLILLKQLQRLPVLVSHVYTLMIVIIGWVFFEFEQLPAALTFIGTMFGAGTHGFADNRALYDLSGNALLLLILTVCATPLPGKALARIRTRFARSGTLAALAIYFIFIAASTAYLVNATYNPFLYFRF